MYSITQFFFVNNKYGQILLKDGATKNKKCIIHCPPGIKIALESSLPPTQRTRAVLWPHSHQAEFSARSQAVGRCSSLSSFHITCPISSLLFVVGLVGCLQEGGKKDRAASGGHVCAFRTEVDKSGREVR